MPAVITYLFTHTETLAKITPVASSALKQLLVLSMLVIVKAQVDQTSFQLMTEDLQWPSTMFMYDELGGNEGQDGEMNRRSLYGKAMHCYISYGALSANRVPCPPRSGRSYYTNNCFKAGGPVHPYTRGCSRITRCRR